MNERALRTRYKPIFYFMSLALLFALIIPLTIYIPCLESPDAKPMGISELLVRNWLPILAFLATLGAYGCTRYVKYQWKGVANPAYYIEEIKNESYEYLTFLTTFIMPLVCMDFTNPRYVLVFFTLVLVIGSIFIRTDLYYGNPTLALMGYRLYRVHIKSKSTPDGIILITKDQLSKGDAIDWIPIDDHVWVVRRAE